MIHTKNITASYTIYWKWWKPAAPTWPRHLLLSSSFPLVFLLRPSCDLKLFMCNVTLPDFVHRGHFHPIRGSSWISCLYRRARRLSNPPASHHITWPCVEFLAEKMLRCRLHHYWANESMNLWKYWNMMDISGHSVRNILLSYIRLIQYSSDLIFVLYKMFSLPVRQIRVLHVKGSAVKVAIIGNM